MKNKILFALLFVTTIINAQISNLAELASGKMEMFAPITELDESIYGYFTIYKLENVSEDEEKYEYVLLDKNLNKVSNGEFIDIKYKKFVSEFIMPQKIGNKIVLGKILFYDRPAMEISFGSNPAKFTFSSHRILDLNTNKISEPFYYEGGQIKEGSRPKDKIKKQTKKIKTFEYPVVFSEGFFLVERLKGTRGSLKEMKSLKTFNINKEEKWDYVYNPKGKYLDYRFTVLNQDDILFWTSDNRTKSQVFHSINPKTGETIFKYELENKKSKYSHLFSVTSLKDKFVIVGKISPYRSSGYNYEKAKGFFRIELDKQGNEISKNYFTWDQISPEIMTIKKNGKLKGGYRLIAKEYFVLEDGSVSILTEKAKDSQYFVLVTTAPKTTDFVILNFDKNFNLKNAETIEKDKSTWVSSDYLYSQSIKNGKGVVFFYKDHKKDTESKKKNWVLGIVSLIEGKMKHEQIPMSSDEHFIYPYIAKEGYILLREFNKDEDYDQIRLERLNY